MSADQDGSVGKDGGWAATEGPQGFYWGGTRITAAAGTDNPTLEFFVAALIIDTHVTQINLISACTEHSQRILSTKNYFEGNASYDEALDLFYKAVVEKYPELSY